MPLFDQDAREGTRHAKSEQRKKDSVNIVSLTLVSASPILQ